MKGKRIIAALCAMSIIAGGKYCNTLTASAKTVDSGAFGENICWEVDDAGILKIFGSGENLDWNWVNDPRIYGHCRIRSVVIGRGIQETGICGLFAIPS